MAGMDGPGPPPVPPLAARPCLDGLTEVGVLHARVVDQRPPVPDIPEVPDRHRGAGTGRERASIARSSALAMPTTCGARAFRGTRPTQLPGRGRAGPAVAPTQLELVIEADHLHQSGVIEAIHQAAD